MKVKELVIKKGVKMSANYNSVSSEIILSVELDEMDDYETIYKELSEKVDELVLQDISDKINQLV